MSNKHTPGDRPPRSFAITSQSISGTVVESRDIDGVVIAGWIFVVPRSK